VWRVSAPDDEYAREAVCPRDLPELLESGADIGISLRGTGTRVAAPLLEEAVALEDEEDRLAADAGVVGVEEVLRDPHLRDRPPAVAWNHERFLVRVGDREADALVILERQVGAESAVQERIRRRLGSVVPEEVEEVGSHATRPVELRAHRRGAVVQPAVERLASRVLPCEQAVEVEVRERPRPAAEVVDAEPGRSIGGEPLAAGTCGDSRQDEADGDRREETKAAHASFLDQVGRRVTHWAVRTGECHTSYRAKNASGRAAST
jgi:hypothetical protein